MNENTAVRATGRLSPECLSEIRARHERSRSACQPLTYAGDVFPSVQRWVDVGDLLREREALLEELQARNINRACAIALLDKWQASMDDPEHHPPIEIHHIDLVVLRSALGAGADGEVKEGAKVDV